MKTPEQIADELSREITERGAIAFMGREGYTPNEFRAEIARRAIEADRAQRSTAATRKGVEIDSWVAVAGSAEYDDEEGPDALVIQIDAPDAPGRIRVNLNDAPIWDGDPETDSRPGRWFKK